MLAEPWHQVLLRIIVRVAQEVKTWQGLQSKALRDFPSGRAWLCKQLGGELLKHIGDVFKVCSRLDAMESLEFDLLGKSSQLEGAGVAHDQLATQDDIADVFGDFASALASARASRTCWFWRGWPLRMVGVLEGGALRSSTMASFKSDWENFKQASAVSNKSVALQAILRRSPFNQQSLQQYVEVRFPPEVSGWGPQMRQVEWSGHPLL